MPRMSTRSNRVRCLTDTKKEIERKMLIPNVNSIFNTGINTTSNQLSCFASFQLFPFCRTQCAFYKMSLFSFRTFLSMPAATPTPSSLAIHYKILLLYCCCGCCSEKNPNTFPNNGLKAKAQLKVEGTITGEIFSNTQS